MNEELLVWHAVWRHAFSKVMGNTVDTELSRTCSHLNAVFGKKLVRDDMFSSKGVLIGFKKVIPSKNQKLPIISGMLKSLLNKLDMGNWDDSVLATALMFKNSLILRNSKG